jgi:cellulose synthase/poly-beta-1,6-N-acetylglucosamine synthase-like glycosyltransferase
MLMLYWLCLVVVAYVYFGYPLLLRLGAFGTAMDVISSRIRPLISIIVAAHNEESVIEAKLQNLLAADYPRERTEILIGSDGSSDRTEEIVRPYVADGVGLISFPQQQGKSAMQNSLVGHASGSILVFTDADCLFAPGALGRIIENFADPRVGLVTARPSYQNQRETRVTENESLYLSYETWLRQQESSRGILAMASGSLFAFRRSLWKPLDPNLGDDFVLPLQVVESGYLNVLETRAVATTHLSQSEPDSLLCLKVRIVSKDFRALLAHRALLNPFRYGRTSVSLGSHKLLRWFVPYFLLGIFWSNFLFRDRPFFQATLSLQSAFYAIALIAFLRNDCGVRSERSGGPVGALLSIPLSFCVVNLAALIATLKCFAGGTSGHWKPDRRQSPAVSNVSRSEL